MEAEKPDGIPGWIKALAATAGLAILFNVAFVWASLSGRRDLVRKDYYQAGLEQDARLARWALAAAHHVELNLSNSSLSVTVSPRPELSPPVTGALDRLPFLEGARCQVSFRRPDDGREDRSIGLEWTGSHPTDPGSGQWRGPGASLRKGRWDVLIEWSREGEVFMESAFERYLEG